MKSIIKMLVTIMLLLPFVSCEAQIKNAKTEIVKIYGNCEMCKKRIEEAGNLQKVVKLNWSAVTKMATIIYDTTKTNQDVILKRVALAGYDNDKFLAPDDTYAKLPNCCQYNRDAKTKPKLDIIKNYSESSTRNKAKIEVQETNQLKAVFENYFAIKEALVKAEGNTASVKAKDLLLAINTVKMEFLKTEEHLIWMKIITNLIKDVQHIAEIRDISVQRNDFMTLSKNIYTLMKVSKQETPTYFQHCPMANNGKGADWLSKESTIKNPYYGSQMLSCGRVVEIIK